MMTCIAGGSTGRRTSLAPNIKRISGKSSPLAMASPSHLGSRSRAGSPDASETAFVTSVSTGSENFGQSATRSEAAQSSPLAMASPSHLGSRGRADSPNASEADFVTSVSTRSENFGQSSTRSEGAQSSPLAMASPSHLGSRSRDDSPDDSKTAFVTSVSPGSENSGQTSKEGERGETSKRRKIVDQRRIQVRTGSVHDDGYRWRKYGSKNFLGAKHPTSYYRCITGGSCPVRKYVQRSDQNPPMWDVTYRGAHACQQRQQLVSPRGEIEQRESQEIHPTFFDMDFMLVEDFHFTAEAEKEATTAPPLMKQSPVPPLEFASSLKVLGWFVQMLFDKSLTATLQHWGVIADKPDLNEAVQSLLDELNSVQAMLSLTQNFRSQNTGFLEILKNLMDAAHDTDDLLSEVDYYRIEQQVNDSEDEDLLRKVDGRLEQQVKDSEDGDLLTTVDYRLQKASISSTPPSFHDINKATIVPRIHEIVSRLERLVTCLSEILSLLQPEEGLRANPNVFPVASHPITTSFLLPNHGNHIGSLPESEFLSVFNKCAFGGEDPSDHLELYEIANQIAGKLDGSLLAATLVGGLLRDNLDEQHWKSVLCSDIWQRDIMHILRFSYHHLPAHLQKCFAYCSVFPKDWVFKKEKLVGMWISQGYVHTKSGGNMSLEEIGSQYFDNLLLKSFIQKENTRETYVLHKLLYDLAESVLEDECLGINYDGTKEITNRVRHVFTHANNLVLLKSCNLINLRTLIIYGAVGDDNNVLKDVLSRLKNIRVLCLQNVSVQLLSGSIGHLIHLRYLTVKTSHQSQPPDSQCRPYHLQWLIFETDSTGPFHCVLPAAMNCLVSLRHFLSQPRGPFEKTGISKFSGIGKLTHLQKLESFEVGKKEGYTLGELKRLNELGGTLRLLCIENASVEDAFESNLNKKTGIRELTLSCSIGHASPQMAEEVFEGLRPPPYIKKLTLDGYNGVKSPSWMLTENHCLSYLQNLRIQNCSFWKVFPTLGKLPLLRHLEIDRAHSVEEIGSNFYGSGVGKAFPCLDTLEFTDMQKLVVWSGIEFKDTSGWVVSSRGKDTFPRLRQLIVTDCPKIKRVPHMTSVELLQTNCLLLLGEIENLTSLKKLLIQDSREIESLPVLPTWLVTLEIRACHQLLSLFTLQLSSLEKLSIHRCDRIQSVPLLPTTLKQLHISSLGMLTAFSMKQEEDLSDLTSLRDIEVSDCPNLRSLPIMPASLQELSIENCPRLLWKSYQNGGDDWHKISHVPTIIWVDPTSQDSLYHPSTSMVL